MRGGRLNALAVSRLSKPGMYPDGHGLYLQIRGDGGRSWIYRYMLRGRARTMGLGPLHSVTLKGARDKAAECRKLRAEGIDPIEARGARRVQAQLEAARAITFGECATSYIKAQQAGWRNPKHAAQWTSSLESHAASLGSLPVQTIDTELVMKVLDPIWITIPETASRVRGRIEAVLDWATVRHYRQGENPARWRGHLDQLLPRRGKVRTVKHHPALPYAEVAAFIRLLREQEGVAAMAMEFTILTAARTGEVIGARWAEIDLNKAVWTVPADRIKAGKEHRVPLSEPALAIVGKLSEPREGAFVFPGGRAGKSLSNMAMAALLERMGRADVTVHGFRSTAARQSG